MYMYVSIFESGRMIKTIFAPVLLRHSDLPLPPSLPPPPPPPPPPIKLF